MAFYMVQNMSSTVSNSTSTYYRLQSSPHVTHAESERFTNDAKAAYALSQRIQITQVQEGPYRSGQNKPAQGKEI